MEEHVKSILVGIGEDPDREGLRDTPRRYIKFLREFTNPPDPVFTTFDAEGTDEMIVQAGIPFFSLCEHHIAPFFGHADIAYVPGSRIVGLSKLARTVDFYANRLQNQERVTQQIAERINSELSPIGVAVHIRAQHLCMCMRGVRKHDTWTHTSKLTGVFMDDPKARAEFFDMVRG